jgi:glycosyltransferase involved in cell wall biosynthesis
MKIKHPQVSVVIPTYNRSSFVKEAIASVLLQTFADFELIIIDDGSSDDTHDAVLSFDDARLIYERQDNKGVSAARNRGVNLARGDKIAFLDSDDLWLPRKLEMQLAFLKSASEIVICQTEELWERHGRRVNPMKKHKKCSGWIFRECLPLCIVSPSAVMMKKTVFEDVGGFDESFPACEDYDLWLRLALQYPIYTMDDALIVKRGGHEGQLSKQWGLDVYRIKALWKILDHPCLGDEHRELVKSEIARRTAIVAQGARKRGKDEMYEEYAGLGLKLGGQR